MATPSPSGSNGMPNVKVRTLRRGAHSCYECSKRKIKCIFLPDKPEECVGCYSRGSKCFGQEYAAPTSSKPRRQNLSSRLSRLEKNLGGTGGDTSMASDPGSSPEPRTSVTSDRHSPPNRYSGQSTRDYAEGSATSAAMLSYSRSRQQDIFMDSILDSVRLSALNNDDAKVGKVLWSILPSGNAFSNVIREHRLLWSMMRARYVSPRNEWNNLDTFVAHASSLESPILVAQVVQVFMLTADEDFYHRAAFMLERLVLSDERYMDSLEGLQTGIMQGVLYGARGRNIKCWSTFRRCLEQAQALGLHRTRMSVDAERIWHSLYNFDRLQSVLVGRPHGIRDEHCRPSRFSLVANTSEVEGTDPMDFAIYELGRLAGRVTDHVQKFNGPQPPPPHELVELSQELSHFLTKLPADFWQVDMPLPYSDVLQSRSWRAKILAQLTYYQTCLALYLPYMLQSFKIPQYEHIRERCVRESRNFAFVYSHFRKPSHPLPIQPRTYDSVGCAATLVLLFSLNGKSGTHQNWEQDNVDLGLIETLADVFGHVSKETVDTSAKESYELLSKLLKSFKDRDASSASPSLQQQDPFKIFTGVNGVDEFLASLRSLGASLQTPSVTSLADEVRKWLEVVDTPMQPPMAAPSARNDARLSMGTCMSELPPMTMTSGSPINATWFNVQFGF